MPADTNTKREEIKQLKEEGKHKFFAGKYEESIKFFGEAISKSSGDAGLYGLKSAACSKLQRYDEALEAAEQMIKLRPKDFKGYLLKGNCLFYLHRLDEALTAYNDAVQTEPNPAVLKQVEVAVAKINQTRRNGHVSTKYSIGSVADRRKLLMRKWENSSNRSLRYKEYTAAVKVQAFWRGTLSRAWFQSQEQSSSVQQLNSEQTQPDISKEINNILEAATEDSEEEGEDQGSKPGQNDADEHQSPQKSEGDKFEGEQEIKTAPDENQPAKNTLDDDQTATNVGENQTTLSEDEGPASQSSEDEEQSEDESPPQNSIHQRHTLNTTEDSSEDSSEDFGNQESDGEEGEGKEQQTLDFINSITENPISKPKARGKLRKHKVPKRTRSGVNLNGTKQSVTEEEEEEEEDEDREVPEPTTKREKKWSARRKIHVSQVPTSRTLKRLTQIAEIYRSTMKVPDPSSEKVRAKRYGWDADNLKPFQF